jgi:hypothetical protein
MVRGFEVSNLLGEMNIRNTDIHPNWNDIRSTAYMNKLYSIRQSPSREIRCKNVA